MANEFRKVTDQNGVDHPVTDDTRVTWTANGVLGAINVVPSMPDASYTVSGITFTRKSDLSIEVNGTSTEEIYYYLTNGNTFLQGIRGSWTARLGVESISGLSCGFIKSTSGSWTLSGANLEETINLTDAEHLSGGVRLYVGNGKTFDHVVIKPSLCPASYPYSGYIPYAMTNRELTDAILNGESYGNVIAISASGQTWAAQLTEIKTAWDNLTLNQKRNAKIIVSGDIYICSNTDTGNFSSVAYAVDGSTPVINAKTLRLSSQTAYKMLLKSTGNTVNDDSSSTNNDRMQLVSGI